jgi:hypothetical protein
MQVGEFVAPALPPRAVPAPDHSTIRLPPHARREKTPPRTCLGGRSASARKMCPLLSADNTKAHDPGRRDRSKWRLNDVSVVRLPSEAQSASKKGCSGPHTSVHLTE